MTIKFPKKTLIRLHQGLLEDSMKTQVEIDNTIPAILEFIDNEIGGWDNFPITNNKLPTLKESLKIHYYTYDKRIKQCCYMITIKGYGTYGFLSEYPPRVPDVELDVHESGFADWRNKREENPFPEYSKLQRDELALGWVTDDHLANLVYLIGDTPVLTAAKERIRWLSRKLYETEEQLEKLKRHKE